MWIFYKQYTLILIEFHDANDAKHLHVMDKQRNWVTTLIFSTSGWK